MAEASPCSDQGQALESEIRCRNRELLLLSTGRFVSWGFEGGASNLELGILLSDLQASLCLMTLVEFLHLVCEHSSCDWQWRTFHTPCTVGQGPKHRTLECSQLGTETGQLGVTTQDEHRQRLISHFVSGGCFASTGLFFLPKTLSEESSFKPMRSACFCRFHTHFGSRRTTPQVESSQSSRHVVLP